MDTWLFTAKVLAVPGRNAIAPNTALNFFLSGMALTLLDWRPGRSRPSQLLALLTIAIAALTVVGYLFGVREFYGFLRYFPMALHTGLNFILLGAAIVLVRPDTGVMAVLGADDAGGRIARRLMPVAVLAPLTLGYLRLVGERRGYYTAPFGVALFAVALAILLTLIILLEARSVSHAEAARAAAQAALQDSQARLAELERAQRNDRFVAHVVNAAAHELATPLTPVILELRALEHIPGMPASAERSLASLKRNVERLQQAASSIVQAARLQGLTVTLERTHVALAELFESVCEEASLRTGRSKAPVTHAPPSDAQAIMADRRLAREALLQLVRHALASAGPGEQVEVAALREGGEVRVMVTRTGHGHSTLRSGWSDAARPEHEGAAALQVVHRIALLHGGRVGDSGGHGEGETLWVTFPAAD